MILVGKSPYFKYLLSTEEECIEIDNVPVSVFDQILLYIYCEQMEDLENVQELLVAANKVKLFFCITILLNYNFRF